MATKEYYHKHREEILQEKREQYKKDPETKKAKMCEHRENPEVKERERQFSAKRYEEQKEEILERIHNHNKEHPERKRAYDNKYQNRRNKQDKEFREKNNIREKTRTTQKKKEYCELCSSKENLEFHHIEYDGSDAITLCRTCHYSIHGKKERGKK